MLSLAERRTLAAELQVHCALEALADGKETQMISVMKRFNRRQDGARDMRQLAEDEAADSEEPKRWEAANPESNLDLDMPRKREAHFSRY